MEFTPFKIVVYSIVVFFLLVAIMYLFLQPKEDATTMLKESMVFAEKEAGKAIESEVYFYEKQLITAESLENENRNVAIKCISPEYCTFDRVEYDGRKAYFKKGTKSRVYSRCEHEVNLYKCSIYIAKKPAQIEISGLRLLDGNEEIEAEIKNTGSFNAETVASRAALYRMMLSDGKWREFKFRELNADVIPLLRAGEKKIINFQFGDLESGSYVVYVKSSADEAGFDEKVAKFNYIAGINSSCLAESPGDAMLIGGICRARLNCSQCDYSYQCRDKWTEKLPQKADLIKGEDREYAAIEYAPSPTTGLCDEMLGTGSCRKNGEEPKAVYNEMYGKCFRKLFCAGCATREDCHDLWFMEPKDGKYTELGTKDYCLLGWYSNDRDCKE